LKGFRYRHKNFIVGGPLWVHAVRHGILITGQQRYAPPPLLGWSSGR